MANINVKTYRIDNIVIKLFKINNEDFIITKIFKTIRNETSIYTFLKKYSSITKCLIVGLAKDYIILKYYFNGIFKNYINKY